MNRRGSALLREEGWGGGGGVSCFVFFLWHFFVFGGKPLRRYYLPRHPGTGGEERVAGEAGGANAHLLPQRLVGRRWVRYPAIPGSGEAKEVEAGVLVGVRDFRWSSPAASWG